MRRKCPPGASAHGLSLYLSTKGDVSTKKMSASCIADNSCTGSHHFQQRNMLQLLCTSLQYPLKGYLFKPKPATQLPRTHCRSMLATQSITQCRRCSYPCQSARKPAAQLRHGCACQRRTLVPRVMLNCRCRFQRQSRLVSSTDSCRQQISDLAGTRCQVADISPWVTHTWLAGTCDPLMCGSDSTYFTCCLEACSGCATGANLLDAMGSSSSGCRSSVGR